MDWSLVCVALIIIHGLLMIYCFLRHLSIHQASLASLDQTIAEAIKAIIQEGVGDFEPINPIQAAIGQFISTRLAEGPESGASTILREADGKFSQL